MSLIDDFLFVPKFRKKLEDSYYFSRFIATLANKKQWKKGDLICEPDLSMLQDKNYKMYYSCYFIMRLDKSLDKEVLEDLEKIGWKPNG